MECWCGYRPQGQPACAAKYLARHQIRHQKALELLPEKVVAHVRRRLAHERAITLCRMYVLGKGTRQWTECRYGHLTDAQVIELIMLILEDV